MTAINGVILGDAAYLFSDGASYGADGTLTGIASKANIMASISTVMLTSGRSVIMPYLASMLELNSESFDHLRDTVEGKIAGYENYLTDLFGEDAVSPTNGVNGFRIFFGGFSERNAKPAIFSISNALTSRDCGVAIDADVGFSAPALSSEETLIGHGGNPVLTPSNMTNVAMTTIELQRQHKWPPLNDCRVGGHVELVVVRRDHIEVKILKRYKEDRIGQKIEPRSVDWAKWWRDHAPKPVIPSAPGRAETPSIVTSINNGINRQQRRALERQARKGAAQ
jgi:hypothetical protein